MARGAGALTVAALLSGSAACSGAEEPDAYAWQLPPALDAPVAPERNPTTEEKVALGARLFSDSRLSANGRYACVTCHDPALAFSDSKTPSVGIYGEALPRQAPSLANVGYLGVYTWANPRLTSLEGQALVPMLARRPSELDLVDRLDGVLGELASDAALSAAFERAFPGEAPSVSLTHVTDALAAYQRTLVSTGSPYDRFLDGDAAALSDAAERGRQLFFSERVGCGACHRGRWLTDAAGPLASVEDAFHNTGLYNLGDGSYPRESPGLAEFTGRQEDRGKFRTALLRNLTLTPPFMHDGSIETLPDVVDHYAAGGRTIQAGPLAGVGADNPNKDARVRGFDVSEQERDDLVEFLESLTDPYFPGPDAATLATTEP